MGTFELIAIQYLIYGLIALVIFLMIKLHTSKQKQFSDGYWLGYEDGYRNMGIVCEMQKMKEEKDDEATKDYE